VVLFWPRASAAEVVFVDMVVLLGMLEGWPISKPCLGMEDVKMGGY
jgi:hypothetical protein